jgi:hypothetical protein
MEKKLNIKVCKIVINARRKIAIRKTLSNLFFRKRKTVKRIKKIGISNIVDEKNGKPDIAIVKKRRV